MKTFFPLLILLLCTWYTDSLGNISPSESTDVSIQTTSELSNNPQDIENTENLHQNNSQTWDIENIPLENAPISDWEEWWSENQYPIPDGLKGCVAEELPLVSRKEFLEINVPSMKSDEKLKHLSSAEKAQINFLAYMSISHLEYIEEAYEKYYSYTDADKHLTQQERFEAIIRMAYERRDDILNNYPYMADNLKDWSRSGWVGF